ncbi:MAG: transposase [Deltaproteobacteria bacterium]|nr:transposase [Deltaproteobacteria bacterium]
MSRGLVAEVGGFNLHAGVRVEADDRDALERLCRYMARPAVAAGRVSVLPDGNVAYRVKSPRSGAATHRVMSPMEGIRRPTRHPPWHGSVRVYRTSRVRSTRSRERRRELPGRRLGWSQRRTCRTRSAEGRPG